MAGSSLGRLLPFVGKHCWLELVGVQGAVLGHFLLVVRPGFFDGEIDDARLVLYFFLPVDHNTSDFNLRLESKALNHSLLIALFVRVEISRVEPQLAANL